MESRNMVFFFLRMMEITDEVVEKMSEERSRRSVGKEVIVGRMLWNREGTRFVGIGGMEICNKFGGVS